MIRKALPAFVLFTVSRLLAVGDSDVLFEMANLAVVTG